MNRHPLSRRTILRGLGTVGIGLPFFEEMLAGRASAAAAAAAVPVRAFNVFFGLGIPAPLQREGFDGVLEPLRPLAEKLLVLRDIDQVRCDESGINAHYDGSAAAFTAAPPDGEARAGGASIDQAVRHACYPDGLPGGVIPSLVGGTFFRRSRVSRYVHSYNPDGTVAATMQEKPRDLFDRVFGSAGARGDSPDARRDRLKRSVLDAVVDQYHQFTGPNSQLGSASKSRLSDHLDRVRELEQRAFATTAPDGAPPPPPPSNLLHGGQADPGGEGIDIRLDELVAEWRLMADLYALAITTDRARFGSITFLAAGERIRLTGEYRYDGRDVFRFDDAGQRNKSGANACSHEWWHDFNPDQRNEALRAHAHLKMREVAYFLSLLDADDARDADGRTVLENALITISTESGDGRHNDPKRELSGVFHAVTSAGGRLKSGQILDVGAEGIDLYNTILDAMGAPATIRLGPADREHRPVPAVLA
jgi:hypothetical protein